MQQIREFCSSIPKLDEALGEKLGRGKFILAAGLQGGGKTILAAQLTRTFVVSGAEVLFLSTEVTPEALYKRHMAAVCSIPYDRIKDGMKTVAIPGLNGTQVTLPDPDVYGEDAIRKAHPLLQGLAQRFRHLKFKPVGFRPRQEFDEILTAYRDEKQRPPDVLIYDHLWYPDVARQDLDPYKMREAVVAAGEALKTLAVEHQMLVIAFCQVDPGLAGHKKIDPAGMFEFKEVYQHADAFVGISQRLRDETDSDLAGGLYERIQHLNVITKPSPKPVLVPVERAFEFQRFEPCRWRPKGKPEDMDELDRRARVIEKTSEFLGYALARRRKLIEIFATGSAHAINLYAFLLLATKPDGPHTGWSFYSRKTQTDMLGLSSKQLIAATDLLLDRGLIDIPVGKTRESLRYRITDWKTDQNPKTKGYFKLMRNLRDGSRSDLMADPEVFRLWLYLLNEVRVFPDEPQELEPGEVLLKPRRIEETLQLSQSKLDAAVERLQARGSVVRRTGTPTTLVIANWHLYQTRVWGSKSSSTTNLDAD